MTKCNGSILSVAALMCLTAFAQLSAAEAQPQANLQLVATNFTSPLYLVPVTDGSGRMLVADQLGTVSVMEKGGKVREQLFFDVRSRLCQINLNSFDERGLIGFVLHPKFKENRKFYAFYSAPKKDTVPSDWDNTARVSEFKASSDEPLRADVASERILLEWNKPYFNHNGGALAFGPDGCLYIAAGDGGNSNDRGRGHSPQGNSQDTMRMMGKILRIDVDNGSPYGIPKDNPFADGKQGKPEIFAWGVRNPWGMSFDKGGKHELFIGDVGQDLFEEVDIIVRGGNYGWNLREGYHGFNPESSKQMPEKTPVKDAEGRPLIDPILEYKHSNNFPNDPDARGISITGGYVYRGKAIPQLAGKYIFGDWNASKPPATGGNLYTATAPAGGGAKWTMDYLNLKDFPDGRLKSYVVGFGQDEAGEVYVLTNDKSGLIGTFGKVWKLVPAN